jgi:hypothetical protein
MGMLIPSVVLKFLFICLPRVRMDGEQIECL